MVPKTLNGSTLNSFLKKSLRLSHALIYSLKGQCHEVFDLRFFHESVKIFQKIRGDSHSARYTTGVVDTSGKLKKSSFRKVLIILFDHLWVVDLKYINLFLQVHFQV
jgi:hypothetical protein